MALSRAARAFNKNPTVENYQKLAREQPAEAAAWVRDFSSSAGLPQRLREGIDQTRWDGALTAAEKTKKLEKLLATNEPRITRAIAKAIEADAVSPVNLGWTTAEATAQVLQGRVGLKDGVLEFRTAKGTFELADGETQIATRDIATFRGSTLSVRGYIEKASSGKGRTLTPQEWTPGQHADFVSGRIERDGNKVGIKVNDEKFVELTHPETKKLFADWERVGFSFAGEVKQVGKRWVYDGAPPETVHMLTSLGDPPAGGPKGQYTGAITPSPLTSSTPTTITGPRVETQGYVRRFVAGHIVPPPANAPAPAPGGYPTRTFEMTKAWRPIDGRTDYRDSGVAFSPLYDGAGDL